MEKGGQGSVGGREHKEVNESLPVSVGGEMVDINLIKER